jgi:hypothetical protein
MDELSRETRLDLISLADSFGKIQQVIDQTG